MPLIANARAGRIRRMAILESFFATSFRSQRVPSTGGLEPVPGDPRAKSRHEDLRIPAGTSELGDCRNPRAIAFFNLGCHGLTVFGMAVRICQRHGHGEDAKTVPPEELNN